LWFGVKAGGTGRLLAGGAELRRAEIGIAAELATAAQMAAAASKPAAIECAEWPAWRRAIPL
jgi:hypothetical protein